MMASGAETLESLPRSAHDGHALDRPVATLPSSATAFAELMASSGPLRVVVHRDLAGLERDWLRFEQHAAGFPFQHYRWLSTWQREIGQPSGAEPFIAVVRNASGDILMLLPLVIERSLGFKRLAPMGDPVCDYHGPLIKADFALGLDPQTIRALLDTLTKMAGVDYVLLTRIPPRLGKLDNPFSALSLRPFSASAHGTNLGADWESFYAERRSTKTRRRFREKEKALGKLGPIGFDIVTDTHERTVLAAEMMRLKAAQLKDSAGAFNTFAQPCVQAFFRGVAGNPRLEDVFIFRLTAGGTLLAAAMGLVRDDCFFYEVPVYPDLNLQRNSPGALLLHRIMAWAIDRGCTRFDFTIGDEAYKADWSDETWHLGCGAWGSSAKGRIGAAAALSEIALKRHIKSKPALLAQAVRLRDIAGRFRPARAHGAEETSSRQGSVG